MKNDSILIEKMTQYFSGDPARIQHFIKVYTFATLIGEGERLDAQDMLILRTAAIVHDIGIRNAETKYGRCDGPIQEQEGPPEAEKLLHTLGYEEDLIERVSYLVAHHHTGKPGSDVLLRILMEADFIVNAYEDGLKKESVMFGSYKLFRTPTGKKYLNTIFALK